MTSLHSRGAQERHARRQRPTARPRSPGCASGSPGRAREWPSFGSLRSVHFRGFFCDGQAHDEGGTVSIGIILRNDFAAMGLDDAVADAETEASAFADFLGGEKRIEDAVYLRDAGAVVAKHDFDFIAAIQRLNFYSAGAADFLHGVVGVVQNIQEDLLKLVRIADNHGKFDGIFFG